MAMIRRLRYRIGRWLIWPEASRIAHHYAESCRKNEAEGKHAEAEHCSYIIIGARYVAEGWSG